MIWSDKNIEDKYKVAADKLCILQALLFYSNQSWFLIA